MRAAATVALSSATAAALVFACTTYGEDQPTGLADSGLSRPTPEGDAGSPPTGFEGGTIQVVEAGPDAASTGEPCPTCDTPPCVSNGCVGANVTTSDCDRPYAMTQAATFTVFVCPDGGTLTLPNGCGLAAGPGGTFPLASIELPTTGAWDVTATAPNVMIAEGTCGTFVSCYGGSASASHNNYNARAILHIGRVDKITKCEAISVNVEAH